MDINYPETILNKSQGFTESEAYLNHLCTNSFLSLWSYPNLFRNQGRSNPNRSEAKGDGKELCDLLVIFDNHIIIFSDKECEFPRSGNVSLDWSRWYRKTVRDAANQIWGAERWILNYPDSVFLDSKCTQLLPLRFPSREDVIVHRIVVAHGASKECIKQLGGSGSLMIKPSVVGDMHMNTKEQICMPFTIGQIDPSRGYVHVFDDTSLEVVMKTVDTISDFIHYLTKKEELIQSGKLVMASGEDDLLAHYLKHIDENGEHTFFPESEQSVNAIYISEGIWEGFCKHPSRLAQIRANQVSYSWDLLIEKFIYHITTGTSYRMSHPDINAQEEGFRFLAKENRTRRRFLSESLLNLIEKTPIDSRTTRTVLPSKPGDPYYLFFLLPKLDSMPYSKYRELRGELLYSYLLIAKFRFPEIKNIIGIATETGHKDERTEDFMYLDATTWTEEDNLDASELEAEFINKGLIGKVKLSKTNVLEYPNRKSEPITYGMKGYERNNPCPCGSGRKFKKCCGNLISR